MANPVTDDIRTNPVFDALRQPLALVENEDRRRSLEAYLEAARPQLDRALFDLMSQLVQSIDEKTGGQYRIRLAYRQGGLGLEIEEKVQEGDEARWTTLEGDVEKIDAVRFLELAYRKLAPGGRLLVRTPCADAPTGASHIFNDMTHKWAATSGVLRWLLGAVGFEAVEIFGEHPNAAMARGALRVPLFAAVRLLVRLGTLALGVENPRVLSPSMWGLGCKPR